MTLVYDSSPVAGATWLDAAYSLSTNQVTVPAGDFLMFHGVQTDAGSGSRVEPWQRFNVGGADNIYGTASEYSRHTGGLDMTAPTAGTVASVGSSTAIDVQSNSLGASGSLPRIASTGGFVGLDLSSLT